MRIAMKQFLLMILIALPSMLHAQQDIPTMEAYIKDHKSVRSMLLARSTLEDRKSVV